MDQEFQKIIEERKQYLPKDLLEAIDFVNFEAKLPEITKKNGLLIDQAGMLRTEVVLVLYGIEPLSSFVSNIQKELSLTREKAQTIAKDTDELIFKTIRERLQKLNEEEDVLEQEQQKKPEENLDREQVLNEIESPSKSVSKVEEIKINLPAKQPENDILVKGGPSLPQKTDGVTITNNVSDKKVIENIVEANLAGPVSLPKEDKKIEERTKIPQKSTDPYREPIE